MNGRTIKTEFFSHRFDLSTLQRYWILDNFNYYSDIFEKLSKSILNAIFKKNLGFFNKMNFFLHLSTCSTCKRIIKELNLPDNVDIIDIKKFPMTLTQIEKLKTKKGSYKSLINNRAQLFKQLNIDTKKLTEDKAKELLNDHYTFLKRPVLVYKGKVFVGNSREEIESAKKWINEQ